MAIMFIVISDLDALERAQLNNKDQGIIRPCMIVGR